MNIVISLLWMIVYVVLQVLLFNELSVAGGVMLVYLYYLIKLPVEYNRSFQIVLGFVTGLLIDIFCNTPGMHALVCTFTMWLRLPVLHLFTQSKQEMKMGSPGFDTLNQPSIFSRYAFAVILLHVLLLYIIEAFTLFDFFQMLGKMVISTVFTLLFVFVLEFTTTRK